MLTLQERLKSMATQTLKVSVQIDDKVIELTGDEAQAFLDDRAATAARNKSIDDAQASAKAALLNRLGITAEEAALLLG